jgi:formylglycine-generating enzyme required for sulfatase activity
MDENGRNYDPEAEDRESPVHPVHQVTFKDFRIARFPVTVREFAGFQEDGGYQVERYWSAGGFGVGDWPESWDDQLKNPQRPVVGVSWFEASAYCAWAGLRLPTEAEWERVARGPRGSRYPWGNEPALDVTRANYNGKIGHPTPAGQYPAGRSVEGVDDLLGNVWEWCSDWYADYSGDRAENPAGPKAGEFKILRGGAWFDFPGFVRVSVRSRYVPALRLSDFGFRCAGDA